MGQKKDIALVACLLIVPIFGQESDTVRPFNPGPVLKSLLIPGTGEYAIAKPGRGRGFIMFESALWISLAGCYITADLDKTKYKAFAAEHAGVDVSKKSKQFWIDVGNYSSRDEFNDEHLRFREIESLYPDSDTWKWNWDSTKNLKKFETIRIRSDRFMLIGQFIIGGIVLNHIISAIDVLYLQRLKSAGSLSLIPVYAPETHNFTYSLQYHF